MIFCLIVVVLSVVLDQLSKYLAVTYLTQIDTFPVIENVLHFTYVENRGAAFGMLSGHPIITAPDPDTHLPRLVVYVPGSWKYTAACPSANSTADSASMFVTQTI